MSNSKKWAFCQCDLDHCLKLLSLSFFIYSLSACQDWIEIIVSVMLTFAFTLGHLMLCYITILFNCSWSAGELWLHVFSAHKLMVVCSFRPWSGQQLTESTVQTCNTLYRFLPFSQQRLGISKKLHVLIFLSPSFVIINQHVIVLL